MKKVIICDDEAKICKLLLKLVNWDELGMNVVSVCYDGVSALDAINEHRPDIVITDISMPGYDGIELIRRSKEKYPETRFIIISGYKQFDYAHNAIKYGVEEYLLKPIEKDDLTNILRKITTTLDEKDSDLKHVHNLEQKLITSMGVLRSQILPQLLSEEIVSDINLLNKKFGTNLIDDSFQLLLIKASMNKEQYTPSAYRLMLQKIQTVAEKLITPQYNEVLFASSLKGVYVLLNDKKENLLKDTDVFRQTISKVLLTRDIFHDISLTIGFSSITNCLAELSDKLVFEASAAAFEHLSLRQPNISYYSDVAALYPTHTFNLPPDFIAEYNAAIEQLDGDRIRFLLKKCSVNMDKDLRSGYSAFHFCSNVFDMFKSKAISLGLFSDSTGIVNFEEASLRYSSYNDIFNMLVATIDTYLKEWEEKKREKSAKPIPLVKAYLQNNYDKPISLESLADEFGFNPAYLSQLFKQETGTNYKDYLLDLRMNAAKNQLQHSYTDIADIANSVGYSDVKHFSKIFKSTTGLSPKEFRKIYQTK